MLYKLTVENLMSDYESTTPSTLDTQRHHLDDDGQRVEMPLLSGETVMAFGPDIDGCTTWESANGVDMLGDDWEKYDRRHERFVLDWDDTCKDSGKFWIVAHREILKDFGFTDEETTDDAILAVFGNIHVGDTLGIERFVKEGEQLDDAAVWSLIMDRAAELIASEPMDPLLVEALRRAKSMGAHLAVWSSSPRKILEATMAANGVEDLFDAVVSVNDVDADKHKPHPQGLLMAVKAMDVAQGYLSEEEDYSDEKPLRMNGVWMVGDSPNDVLGGKSVGASTVWIEHPLQGHNAHEKREKNIRRIRETMGAIAVKQVSETMNDLRPTLTIRTFDPEEAGYARNTSIMDMPAETVRGLTTVNINLVKFLIDRNLRAESYRWEHVRRELDRQGVELRSSGEDVAAAFYGHTVTAAKTITPRTVTLAQNSEEAQRSLRNIASKLESEVLL